MEFLLTLTLIFNTLFCIVYVWCYIDFKRNENKTNNDVFDLDNIMYSMLPPRKEGESDVEWRDRIVKCWK